MTKKEEQEEHATPEGTENAGVRAEEKIAEIDILRQSLEACQENEAKTKDAYLRTMADFDNYRKRAEARVASTRAYAREEAVLDLLPFADALRHAIDQTQGASDLESIRKGVQLVGKQFEKFLGDYGVTPIESVGARLDPSCHEAIAHEAADAEEGTVLAEFQKGYRLNDRVIRTAKVKVASAPPAQGGEENEPADESAESEKGS